MSDKSPYYVLDGEAIDQEAIIKLRPLIEEEVVKEFGEFEYTELFWNMLDNGMFWYKLNFYDKDEVESE